MMLKEYWVPCGEIRVRKLRWQFSFRDLLIAIALAAGVCAAAREIHWSWKVHQKEFRGGAEHYGPPRR